MAVVIDETTGTCITGTVADVIHFHFDVEADVLYLRLIARQGSECYGEETPDGFLLLRTLDEDAVAGVTVISYWQRYGLGSLSALNSTDFPGRIEALVACLPVPLVA